VCHRRVKAQSVHLRRQLSRRFNQLIFDLHFYMIRFLRALCDSARFPLLRMGVGKSADERAHCETSFVQAET
jgi:hypothetical protein